MVSMPAGIAVGASGETDDWKIRRAGIQFEAVLLNKVLGDLERAFTSMPGKKPDNSNQAYSGWAMQSLSAGLAEAGGVGIGAMIAKTLGSHKGADAAEVNQFQNGGPRS